MRRAAQQRSGDASEARLLGWTERRQRDVLTAFVAEVQDYAILMLDAEGKVVTWVAAWLWEGHPRPD
jgi:hypothetical protein